MIITIITIMIVPVSSCIVRASVFTDAPFPVSSHDDEARNLSDLI